MLDSTVLLATATQGRQYRAHLYKALCRLSGEEDDLVSSLEGALAAVVAEHAEQRGRGRRRWAVFFGVQMPCQSFSPGCSRVHVLGKEFAFISGVKCLRRWNAYAKNQPWDFFEEKPPSLVIAAITDGVDGTDAYRGIAKALDTLRGCIELRLNFGVSQFSSAPTSLCKFPAADWMIATRARETPQVVKFIKPSTTRPSTLKRSDSLSPEKVQDAINLFAFLRHEPDDSSIDSLIGACLRLYVQAMDQVLPSAQFLGLWQLAEAICGVKPGQTQGDPVPQRLGWFQTRLVNFEALAYKECVQYLQNLRHDLVHKGTLYEINEEDVNLLKYFCEGAINFWLSVREKLLTREHLNAFYNLLGRTPASRVAMSDAAVLIRDLTERT